MEGISIVFTNPGGGNNMSIKGGACEIVSQKKTQIAFAAEDALQFWGFKVETEDLPDDSLDLLTILSSDVLKYDPVEFKAAKDAIREYPGPAATA